MTGWRAINSAQDTQDVLLDLHATQVIGRTNRRNGRAGPIDVHADYR